MAVSLFFLSFPCHLTLISNAPPPPPPPPPKVDAYCSSSFRVRVAHGSGHARATVRDGLPGPYVPDCTQRTALTGAGTHTNGNLKVDVADSGAVVFTRVSDGVQLASVSAPAFGPARNANSSYLSYAMNVTTGDAAERVYGMGELEGLPKRESCDVDGFALPWARNGMDIQLATSKFQVRGGLFLCFFARCPCVRRRGPMGATQAATASAPAAALAHPRHLSPLSRSPSPWPSAPAATPCLSTRPALVRRARQPPFSTCSYIVLRPAGAFLTWPRLRFSSGVASFGNGSATWSLDAQVQVDYWFTTIDAPADAAGSWDGRFDDLYKHYVDATGHAPMLPDNAGAGRALVHGKEKREQRDLLGPA